MNKENENKKNSYRYFPSISDGYNRIIKQTDENTWLIIDNESGEIINTITKDVVIDYCKRECEENNTDYMSSDGITDSVWYYIDMEYDLEFVDNYCQEYDKFLAWFDYTCVEYLAKEIVAFYKQRLLNFE